MRLLEGPPLTEEEWAAAEKRFPRDDWRYEVGNGDTVLGYAEWLEHRILGSSDGGDRYFCLDSCGEAVFPSDRVTVTLKQDGSPLSFSGTVLRFNIAAATQSNLPELIELKLFPELAKKPATAHDAGALFLEVFDQYRDLFECLPSQIVLKEAQ